MDRIVCKFGGTSLATADMFRQTEAILKADERRRVVVVSAPGKRDDGDHKITDLLLLSHHLAAADLDTGSVLQTIGHRFGELADGLGVSGVAEQGLQELREGIAAGRSQDWVASRGEAITARLLAAQLDATFVEAADVVKIDAERRPMDESYELLAAAVGGDGLYVVPGFYGSGSDGEVKVFSRGGSDITGAMVARAAEAMVYENWTDVSGFMMADPRIVKNARPMRTVTYAELRELAYLGATVLHEEAIFPVREVGIPIHIRNTARADDPGTLIVPDRDATEVPVVGIAGKPSFTVIHITKTLMNRERGFGRRVLGILETHGVSYEHSPTGIDSMSVVIDDAELGDRTPIIVDEIQRTLEPEGLEVDRDLALLTVVGKGMAHQVGIAARCFNALGKAGINVRMIVQGVAEISIIVGVSRADFEAAVKALYQAFVAAAK